jgi:hypothetical protein
VVSCSHSDLRVRNEKQTGVQGTAYETLSGAAITATAMPSPGGNQNGLASLH